jgi:hypothetical protein
MPIPANPPELIISLSRDKVGLLLSEKPQSGRKAWQFHYPVQGVFLEEQVSNALDAALNQNPSLVDHFDDVAILILDRPNLFLPAFYADNGNLPEIAGRYLSVKSGDILAADAASGDIAIAYSIPSVTIRVLKEYYVTAGQIHMSSVLWNAISQLAPSASNGISRLFFHATENTLFVIGETSGKLTFSKNFYIREQADLSYYVIACSKMISPTENWLVTMKEGAYTLENIAADPNIRIHHRLELPELHTLIARHRSCGL